MKLILALFFVVVAYTFHILHSNGVFKSIESRSVLDCTKLEGVLGSEDITIDQQTGLAFISSGQHVFPISKPQGKIFVLDLKAKSHELRKLAVQDLPYPESEFNPHGIDLFRRQDGRLLLFVVSHPIGAQLQRLSSVIIFEFLATSNALLFIDEFQDQNLARSLNDVRAVGERQFYASVDHALSHFRFIEDYIQIPLSYVVYFNGSSFSVAAKHIGYANGVTTNVDGTRLYIGAVIDRVVYVYERDVSTGQLVRLLETIPLDFGVDNLELDPATGDIYVAGHPNLLSTVKHLGSVGSFTHYPYSLAERGTANGVSLAPSQVSRIRNNGTAHVVEELLQDDGSLLSGASVAAHWKRQMLIGSVAEPFLLHCLKRD